MTVPNDPGPFVHVGFYMLTNGFSKRTGAMSYASPEAFYIIETAGGLLSALTAGGFVGGFISGSAGSQISEISCKVRSLPKNIASAIDPSGKHADRDVLIFPRRVIDRVRLGRLGALAFYVKVTAGELSMSLSPALLSGTRLRRELGEMKWL